MLEDEVDLTLTPSKRQVLNLLKVSAGAVVVVVLFPNAVFCCHKLKAG